MQKSRSTKRLLVPRGLAGLGAVGLPALARAKDAGPSRSLRLKVSSAPGGAANLTSRRTAQHLPKRLGRRLVLENRGGAASDIPWQMKDRVLLPILEGRADTRTQTTHIVCGFKDGIGRGRDRSQGSMVVEHGHPIGETFDHDREPGEFYMHWNDVELRAERLKLHPDAVAEMVSAGPPRSAPY